MSAHTASEDCRRMYDFEFRRCCRGRSSSSQKETDFHEIFCNNFLCVTASFARSLQRIRNTVIVNITLQCLTLRSCAAVCTCTLMYTHTHLSVHGGGVHTKRKQIHWQWELIRLRQTNERSFSYVCSLACSLARVSYYMLCGFARECTLISLCIYFARFLNIIFTFLWTCWLLFLFFFSRSLALSLSVCFVFRGFCCVFISHFFFALTLYIECCCCCCYDVRSLIHSFIAIVSFIRSFVVYYQSGASARFSQFRLFCYTRWLGISAILRWTSSLLLLLLFFLQRIT